MRMIAPLRGEFLKFAFTHHLVYSRSQQGYTVGYLQSGNTSPMQELTPSNIAERLHLLTEVSVALGESNDIGAFLDRILRVAKGMTNADGGTLYRPSPDG